MQRLSFRLSLLCGFLLVSCVLGAAAWRGLSVLEGFAAESRAGAAQALRITADVQQIAERSVDLERSARQYLVLGEPELLARFTAIRQQVDGILDRLAGNPALALDAAAAAWRAAAADAATALTAKDGKATLAALATLGARNAALADAVRQGLDAGNARLLTTLEANRRALAVEVGVALAAALAIALAIGCWLVRPIAALEAAIERLGAGEFAAPVAIGGPDDLRRLGQRLDWLRRRLAALEADRMRVLRHVSHELKTPLAAIREGVSLLQEEVPGPLSADQREVATILEQNSRALHRQIEDLLAYHAAVFDAGRVRYRRQGLPALLQSVADERCLQLQARSLRVTVAAGALELQVDADKLRVALGNLLSNAIAFSPPGGEIRVSARVADGRLQIDCCDSGPGVAPEDSERIFEPFVQGRRRPDAATPGSGVGLSIVRELVAAQGGRVFLLASAAGAHFRMELPYEN